MALNFISIPTEQTTAVTDLILAAQSMICLLLVRRTAENQGFSSIAAVAREACEWRY